MNSPWRKALRVEFRLAVRCSRMSSKRDAPGPLTDLADARIELVRQLRRLVPTPRWTVARADLAAAHVANNDAWLCTDEVATA